MNAERERDALVAERLMGIKVNRLTYAPEPYSEETGEPVLHYTTDIAAAWPVFERLKEFWPYLTMGTDDGGGWYVTDRPFIDDNSRPVLHADTAPLAICLAALKAVGVDP